MYVGDFVCPYSSGCINSPNRQILPCWEKVAESLTASKENGDYGSDLINCNKSFESDKPIV